jgi:hypothetical protein
MTPGRTPPPTKPEQVLVMKTALPPAVECRVKSAREHAPKKHADAVICRCESQPLCVYSARCHAFVAHVSADLCVQQRSEFATPEPEDEQQGSRLLSLYSGSNTKTLAPAASSRRQSQRKRSTLTTSATATCVLSMTRTTLIRLAKSDTP